MLMLPATIASSWRHSRRILSCAPTMFTMFEQLAISAPTFIISRAMSEIIVEDSYYDRGCDVVETWYADLLAEQKRMSGVYCRKCGSRNYDRTWNEAIGYIYKCKDCGEDFVR